MAGEDSSKERTPSSSKLPAKSLSAALEVAQALRDYAVSASRPVIAGQMGTTTSSSAFQQKFAAARYFGLIEKDGDKFKLTSRGNAALDGDDVAKRTAVMATGFGPIIASLSTRQVTPNIIESRLKSDHGASESGAKTGASILVKSAEDAGLVVNEKFDAKAIESVDSKDIGPRATGSGSDSTASRQGSAAQKKTQAGKTAKPDPPKPDPPKPDPPAPPVEQQAPVQVVVQLDGSKMEPAKIAELIKLLRTPN
jgi:hypothetical protein